MAGKASGSRHTSTPAFLSRLNLVDRLFCEITLQRIPARRLQKRYGSRNRYRHLDRRGERQADPLQVVG